MCNVPFQIIFVHLKTSLLTMACSADGKFVHKYSYNTIFSGYFRDL